MYSFSGEENIIFFIFYPHMRIFFIDFFLETVEGERERRRKNILWLPPACDGIEPATKLHTLGQESNLRPFSPRADALNTDQPARASLFCFRHKEHFSL